MGKVRGEAQTGENGNKWKCTDCMNGGGGGGKRDKCKFFSSSSLALTHLVCACLPLHLPHGCSSWLIVSVCG